MDFRTTTDYFTYTTTINWQNFITKAASVYCAVRNEYLNMIHVNLDRQRTGIWHVDPFTTHYTCFSTISTQRIKTVVPWVKRNQAFHIQLPARHVRNLSPRYKLSTYTRSERYYGWYVNINDYQLMINELNFYMSNEDDRTKWNLNVNTETIYLQWISETLIRCNYNVLRAFTKLRKATISFVMSDCPSVCLGENNSAPTGRIFMKFHIWVFFENLSTKSKFH
jgi:hypothetical protein